MPQSFTCLHYHIIFSTKGRRPLIEPALKARLYSYVGGILSNQKGVLLEAGGTADHVHLLAALSPQIAVSDYLRLVKGNSSKWMHEEVRQPEFGWQDGYGAFAVSYSNMPHVRAYIQGQEEHHRRVSFQEEFVEFLKRHNVPYDERYIWS
jgi:putative transposase